MKYPRFMDNTPAPSMLIPLQKLLIRARCGSKNQVRIKISEGQVDVNGETVTRFAHPVRPGDQVRFCGQVVEVPPERLVWLMNKPKKHLTQIDDRQQRPGLGRYLPDGLPRLFPVGRLDYNSEGALLWTDDGILARRILHPSWHLPKVYQVKIRGHLDADDPRLEQMRVGIDIGEGVVTQPAEVSLGELRTRATWVRIVLREGKNRQIRRMCAAMRYQIVKLRRVAIGPVSLGTLNPRCARALTGAELQALRLAVGLPPAPTASPTS